MEAHEAATFVSWVDDDSTWVPVMLAERIAQWIPVRGVHDDFPTRIGSYRDVVSWLVGVRPDALVELRH